MVMIVPVFVVIVLFAGIVVRAVAQWADNVEQSIGLSFILLVSLLAVVFLIFGGVLFSTVGFYVREKSTMDVQLSLN